MQITKLLVFFLTGIILVGCSSNQKRKDSSDEDSGQTHVETIEEEKIELPPLEAEQISYKNKNPFGTDIELAGKQFFIDTIIFKVRETQMIVKNEILGVQNYAQNQFFMRYSIPEVNFLSMEGNQGNGPDEFLFPNLIPTPDPTLLAYIMEGTNEKLYKWDKSGNIVPYEYSLFNSKIDFSSDKQLINIAPDDFLYVAASRTGKSIFRIQVINDSIQTREVLNLALNPKRKSWTNYVGDFVANPKLNRMAYAYKYFKIIKFMDMEAKTIKTINFEREEFDESTNYVINGMDQNVTHYWGACAGEKYVYFLYSGRKPVEVMRENNKKTHYIYIEQYDWNGNPVAKYKLDRWGYFTVDEKNKAIYLASTNDDDPFFVFKMPE